MIFDSQEWCWIVFGMGLIVGFLIGCVAGIGVKGGK